MSFGAWASAAGALAGIALILVKVWYESTPERKEKKRRNANLEMHRKIYGRDVDAIRRDYDRMRGEDS